MSDAAQLTPCNHSVCHKGSEAVDNRQLKVERKVGKTKRRK